MRFNEVYLCEKDVQSVLLGIGQSITKEHRVSDKSLGFETLASGKGTLTVDFRWLLLVVRVCEEGLQVVGDFDA